MSNSAVQYYSANRARWKIMSQQSQNESRQQHHQQLEKIQRQQTRRYIFLPFIILLLIFVAIIAVIVSLRTPTQVAVVSDMLFTIFILCPLVICMFPVAIIMFVLIALMNRLHDGTKSPLRRLEQWTYTMEQRVDGWARIVDSRVIHYAVKFAPIRRILTIFDTPSSSHGNQDEGENNDSSTTEQ
jgi:ABC-type transport system involved in multi-copper enzyme maturation permease subunit